MPKNIEKDIRVIIPLSCPRGEKHDYHGELSLGFETETGTVVFYLEIPELKGSLELGLPFDFVTEVLAGVKKTNPVFTIKPSRIEINLDFKPEEDNVVFLIFKHYPNDYLVQFPCLHDFHNLKIWINKMKLEAAAHFLLYLADVTV